VIKIGKITRIDSKIRRLTINKREDKNIPYKANTEEFCVISVNLTIK